jgi:predicted RND superfamily exporter protein
MRNARLRYRSHDPARESDRELQERLSEADYVLLVADAPCYDVAAIQQQLGDRIIDVRDHRFDGHATTDESAGAAGDKEQSLAVSTIYTGVVPVVYKAQRTLLDNLISSIAWAFVMIAIVLVFVLRSPSAALVSMLPNVFPVVVIFGLMGWLGIQVDVGSMMTASVAMGIAVDDTIHFLTWYRRGLDEGLDRMQAIWGAYRRVARAMAQTTAIAGLGMAVFALSTFTPTQRFGTLMLALMAAALVGDLVFLPALLVGPFGRLFGRSKQDKERHEKCKTQLAEAPSDCRSEATDQDLRTREAIHALPGASQPSPRRDSI